MWPLELIDNKENYGKGKVRMFHNESIIGTVMVVIIHE